jgi:hypothetical protein
MKVGRINNCSVSGLNGRPSVKNPKGKNVRQKMNLMFYGVDGVESSCSIPTGELGMMRVCMDLSSVMALASAFASASE